MLFAFIMMESEAQTTKAIILFYGTLLKPHRCDGTLPVTRLGLDKDNKNILRLIDYYCILTYRQPRM